MLGNPITVAPGIFQLTNNSASLAMSKSPSPSQPIAPLSIGNVVSTALVLCRSHLKTYLQLALTAYLWFIVPVYGWAKYFAISATLSRLAFRELIGQPESIRDARRYIKPRLWSFFRVAFQVFIYIIGVYLMLSIAFFITVALLALILGFIAGFINNQILNSMILGIVFILSFIGFIFGFIWFFSRWIVAEVPLAIESDINGGQSITRSWELTKHSVPRIQGVVVVTFLVTLPILFLTSYIPQILLILIEEGTDLFWFVYFISLLISLAGGVLVLPFWQVIKAVLYYDLRSRREGLDLQIRDSM